MSIEGCALQLLRATGVQAQQLTTLLHQFNGRLPTSEAEYQTLVTQLRRIGHIHEAAPGNIATILQGPFRQARSGQYFTEDNAAQQLQQYWAADQGPSQSLQHQPVASWAAGRPSGWTQWIQS